jgi:hypothetical protein
MGGSLNADYLSKKGAFNGSGIALAGESWNPATGTLFTLYFQHHTGDIRYLKYTKGQKWIGGGITETVASNAKNATPISAVAYVANTTQFVSLMPTAVAAVLTTPVPCLLCGRRQQCQASHAD